MSRLVKLSARNFQEEVLESDVPVLVEFSASWCLPSRQQEPVLQQIAREFDGKLKVADLNVDRNPAPASRYRVMGCPTFVVFQAGEEVVRRTGAQSRARLLEMVQAVVNVD